MNSFMAVDRIRIFLVRLLEIAMITRIVRGREQREGDQDGLDQDIYIVPDIRIRDFCYMVPAVLKPYGVVADLIFLI